MNDSIKTAPWLEQYRTRGYTILPQLLPYDMIDAHLQALEAVWARHGFDQKQLPPPAAAAALAADVRALHLEYEASLSLSLAPALRSRAQEVLEDEPVLGVAFSHRWELGREPHRDAGLIYHDPPDKICRTWAALENIHPDAGMLYLVPGTHLTADVYDDLLREHPHLRQSLEDLAQGSESEEEWRRKRAPLQESITAQVLKELAGAVQEPIPLRKGDVLLFDVRLIHGTLPCRDATRTRKVMIQDWRTRDGRSYFASAYFGSSHDYRNPENAAPRKVRESPLGPYMWMDEAAGSRWLRQRTVPSS
jgi:hypothetical protein